MLVTSNARISDRLRGLENDTRPRIVATRGGVHGGVAASGTTYTRGEHRFKSFSGPRRTHSIQLLFGNFHNPTGAAVEVAGPSAGTVEAALEVDVPAAAFLSFSFDNALTKAMPVGGIIATDKHPAYLPGNSQFFLRTGIVVAAGQSWVRQSFWASAGFGDYQMESTEATSQVHATGAMLARNGQTAGGGFLPFLIIGETDGYQPSIGFVGDSLMAGTIGGDATSTVNGARGPFQRAAFLTNGTVIPYVNLARATEQNSYYLGFNNYRRKTAYPYCERIVCNLGSNDAAGGMNLATMQANAIAHWTEMKAAGCKIFQSTIWTRTNGGNTTPSAGFTVGGVVDQFNTWLFTQIGIWLDGVIDVRSLLQTAANLWISATYTSDGTHLTPAGTLIAADGMRVNYFDKWAA